MRYDVSENYPIHHSKPKQLDLQPTLTDHTHDLNLDLLFHQSSLV